MRKKRVPLNRLVLPETFEGVKTLAGALHCSEGEVLDQAVVLFESSLGGKVQEVEVVKEVGSAVDVVPVERQMVDMEELRRLAAGMVLGAAVPAKKAEVATSSLVASTLGQNRCIHCERYFERADGAKASSMCNFCGRDGHQQWGACRKCIEDAEVARRTAADKSGGYRDDIDRTAFND